MKYRKLKKALGIGVGINPVEIVLEGLKGESLDEICSKYKINKSAYEILLKKFIEGGSEKLESYDLGEGMGDNDLKRTIKEQRNEIKNLYSVIKEQEEIIKMLEEKLEENRRLRGNLRHRTLGELEEIMLRCRLLSQDEEVVGE